MSEADYMKLLQEQKKTNELLTKLIAIFMDEDDDEEQPMTYLSGKPIENPKT